LNNVSFTSSPDGKWKLTSTRSIRGTQEKTEKGVDMKLGASGIKLTQPQNSDHHMGCLNMETF
jgi:hypothetical protein